MKTVAFIPIKFNSERIPGKNIKRFSDNTPLIVFIQKVLLQVKELDDIYCYCSNEAVKEYLLDGVNYLKRDERFDRNDASPNELHKSFCEKVNADIYVASHATAPFTSPKSISACIKKVASDEYDSAVLGEELREFFWQDGKPFNFDLANIPRTQDLKPLYKEVNGAYIFTKETMFKYNSRTGKRVYVCPIDKIAGIDIDYPEDFAIADAIYTQILKGKACE
jgi:CMP-N-acetylneuraminic acid synthetase